MLLKQLFSIGVISALLLGSVSSHKMHAHDPRLVGIIGIGSVMAAGGIYQMCKEKGSKIGGLTLLTTGTAIILGSDKIINPRGLDLLIKNPTQFFNVVSNDAYRTFKKITKGL